MSVLASTLVFAATVFACLGDCQDEKDRLHRDWLNAVQSLDDERTLAAQHNDLHAAEKREAAARLEAKVKELQAAREEAVKLRSAAEASDREVCVCACVCACVCVQHHPTPLVVRAASASLRCSITPLPRRLCCCAG
jgi:hypothetical protein